MEIQTYIKYIKRYAILSIIFPIVAINTCLAIYLFLGNYQPQLNAYDYDKKEFVLTFDAYKKITNISRETFLKRYGQSGDNASIITTPPPSIDNYSYANCPKNLITQYYFTTDKKNIEIIKKTLVSESAYKEFLKIEKDIWLNNRIESVIWKQNNNINHGCIKNNKFIYYFFTKFNFIESFMMSAFKNNPAGFADIKNPYIYGEVSISRTARYWPASFIFKSLMIFCSICLFMYWRNNLSLLRISIPNQFTRSFYYLGMLSSLFLLLHAAFLGMDFDSKILSQIRRSVLLLFLIFEVCAQFSLTKVLIKNKYNLKDYISFTILKIKTIFVGVIIILSLTFIFIFYLSDVESELKHILEWNYFPMLLIYYYLSFKFWENKKT